MAHSSTKTASVMALASVALVLVVAGCSLTAPVSPNPAVQPTSEAAATGTHPPAASPAPRSATVDEIERFQAAIDADPSDAEAQRDLGFALLQRVRETADPSLYAPAEAAFETARAAWRRTTPLVLVGIGGLQLGKHQFADGARDRRARAIDAVAEPRPSARAIVVDALVELGRYDEADDAAAEMLGAGIDLTTLSRVSYLAELHGKLDVAADARCARPPTSRGLAPENLAFVHVLLGNLLVYSGDPRAAADAYDARPRRSCPGHAPSLAGEGRLAVAAGDLDEAIDRFQRAADIVPLPEYVIALADAQAAAGRADDAAPQRRARPRRDPAVRGERASSSTSTWPCSRPITAIRTARWHSPRRRYAATPTVRAADALAWALHRLGRDREARRLVRRGAPARARATRCFATTPARSRPRSAMSPPRDATSNWRSRPTRASRRPAPPRPAGSSIAARLSRRAVDSSEPRRSCASRDDSTGRWSRPASAAPGPGRPRGGPRIPAHIIRERSLVSTRSRVVGIAGALLIAATSVTRRPRVQPPGGAAHRGRSRAPTTRTSTRSSVRMIRTA